MRIITEILPRSLLILQERQKIIEKKVIELIELAELNEDKEVVLAGEEVLQQILPYRKQADIWAVEAKRYEGNYKSFDARIKTFTTMIPIVE